MMKTGPPEALNAKEALLPVPRRLTQRRSSITGL
jgi:hypothetical protein